MNHIVSIGTSHHVAPIEIRERLAFSEEQLIESHHHLRELDQVQEAVILSTCNRVEVYAVLNSVRTAGAAVNILAEFLSRCHQIDMESLKKWTYLHHNLETIQHLFRVISSLDSMVVGESQILGQVKDAYDTSRSVGSTGPILNRLFTKAFSVGKRIRSETTITTGAVSISYAAVELAKKIFNTLEGKTVAIIGAGEMSELTAKHLVANGVSNVIVANRTYERAVKVAEKFNGTPLAYDSDLSFLIDADIVISSTNARDYLIKRQPLADIMRKRKHRHMFLIDIAVPRDIEPDVGKLDSAFLYNIDDLEAVVASNLKDRQHEALRAEQIVSEEAKRFYDQLQIFEVNPTIKALHQQFRQIADTELQACFYKTTLSDQQEEAITSMTQAIVKKLLHHPMQNLRCAVNDGNADHGQYVQALQELFALDVNDENSEQPSAVSKTKIRSENKARNNGAGDSSERHVKHETRSMTPQGKIKKLVIGTRGSQLALWQAQFVKHQLERHFPTLEVSLKTIKTTGDAIQNRSLVGLGKGIFTKEIENALLIGDIDLAVHSLKDLPTELPEGLCIAAIPTREDPRDVLITDTGVPLEDLPEGAKIGTTSPRRKAQLLYIRPDLQVVDVRGNIDTRLRKLRETDLDGIILAAAGIKRLLEPEIITQFFDTEQMIPAVGQGALAIEVRENDDRIEKLLMPLNDASATAEITAERGVLEGLGGGCQVPIGAHAKHVDGELSLIGAVCHPDGTRRIVERTTGRSDTAQHLGSVVAEKLRNSGATELLMLEENPR